MRIINQKIGLVLIIIMVLTSCNLDIIENQYQDYNQAIENGFIGNGYIPIEFIKESIFDIRTILNVDLNESLIKFRISDKNDWDSLINSLEKCDIDYQQPKSFAMPEWWDLDMQNHNAYCFIDKNGLRFHFAIDFESQTLYSW